MSITTTETTTAVAAGEPRTLLDAIVEVGALIGRIGERHVLEVRVHEREVRIDLRADEDAWGVGAALGLPGRKLDDDDTSGGVSRVAYGYDASADLSVEVWSDVLPDDDTDAFYAERARQAAARRAETAAHFTRPGEVHIGSSGLIPGWTDRD